jgi:hypothetical protein
MQVREREGIGTGTIRPRNIKMIVMMEQRRLGNAKEGTVMQLVGHAWLCSIALILLK